ncbi:MAG: lipopolysaccharide biosynthesis protein [Fusobacteriaceae bacterium]|jgi:O-antigen/teichoic acid export membrane protein|nr:lipopolysaccharide biosynthesis protein [Fusobacteriaceae bacterium]
MTNLKQKTIHGLTWSFIDNFANQGVTFLVGIVLARLIEPAEFGILGMISIFTAIAVSFVDSGFSSALIQKKDCTEIDYSTAFYFNLFVSISAYCILFFAAPFIARFFEEPRLVNIIKISCLSLIINAIALVQRVLLSKNINFKAQAKISVSSSIIAGVIAIILAYQGMGVWSLVWRGVVVAVFTCLFLWLRSNWRPIWLFSMKSFKELFGFGSKLLLAKLISTIYDNIYYPIIGKYFSPATLGFYTRAEAYSGLFSSMLSTNITRVSYPILASIQDNMVQLKRSYRKILKSTMLLTFTMMLGLAAVAKPLVIILIGEKWLPCVPYLQLLCLSMMFYPLHLINLNIITVKGRSDLCLKLEIAKKIIAVPLIFIAILWGVEALLIGNIVISIISYFLNSYYSADLVNYPAKEQLADVLPLLLVAACVSSVVFSITLFHFNDWFTLILQIITGAILTIGTYEKLKNSDYLEMKKTVTDNIKKRKQ